MRYPFFMLYRRSCYRLYPRATTPTVATLAPSSRHTMYWVWLSVATDTDLLHIEQGGSREMAKPTYQRLGPATRCYKS
jgi:hypothetical protein